ncbi:MAG: hypothetical protein LBU97_03915 [Alistipes sp.]|jgi:hypothetical protein|nr:hypothetical protein [Alistipes sp.]
MKNLFYTLCLGALLWSCDKPGQPSDITPTPEEIAAIEGRIEQQMFVDRLVETLIDPATGDIYDWIIATVVEGEYVTGAADSDKGSAAEAARAIVDILFGGYGALDTTTPDTYAYNYTIEGDQYARATGAMSSTNGVFATIELRLDAMPELHTLLIKTEGALSDENLWAPPGMAYYVVQTWWECQNTSCGNGRQYSLAEATELVDRPGFHELLTMVQVEFPDMAVDRDAMMAAAAVCEKSLNAAINSYMGSSGFSNASDPQSTTCTEHDHEIHFGLAMCPDCGTRVIRASRAIHIGNGGMRLQ